MKYTIDNIRFFNIINNLNNGANKLNDIIFLKTKYKTLILNDFGKVEEYHITRILFMDGEFFDFDSYVDIQKKDVEKLGFEWQEVKRFDLLTNAETCYNPIENYGIDFNLKI